MRHCTCWHTISISDKPNITSVFTGLQKCNLSVEVLLRFSCFWICGGVLRFAMVFLNLLSCFWIYCVDFRFGVI